METKKKWLFTLLVLMSLAVLGIFMPSTPLGEIKGVNSGDLAWMLTSTALVLLMTPGLSFFYGGMINPKNIISTILQSFVSMGIVSVLWVLVGFSLAFGDSIGGYHTGLIGNPTSFFMLNHVGAGINTSLAPTIPLALFAIFQMKFAIITPALITGSFAGRVRFRAYILFIILFIIFVYAPLAHQTWHPNGLLRNMGVLDFAGGTVVHMSAGFAALAGAIFLGKRNDYDMPEKRANIPFVLLGAGLLWFGWFGFNAGSALAANAQAISAFLNTNTAAAAAMLAYIFTEGARGEKPSGIGAAVGLVVGLVAITPSAGYVTVGESILIGAIAGVICNYAVSFRTKTTIDDTLDVFPAHGMGGVVGMILTGVFAKDVGLTSGSIKTFTIHLAALTIVASFSFGMSYLLYWVTNKIVPMRVSSHSENVGLDISQHHETYGFAYKD
ncbi:ammonium transporter [Acetobacteroides hydrogenigenes]|uniref:Ammonium transporter n=1 Tax=Acetobacteroides hydrogenigenes TaxID=979970 RepID=A0A4R2EZD3_9BACT|nr:ammonium transporter [Acetobacteroides hydrogenigenes]TCN70079.1 Amt family ammonium transporter [Acetobacteroides hydrogenigenes]